MKGINIKTHDPAYNLAVEEVFFNSLSEVGEEYFCAHIDDAIAKAESLVK